MTPVQWQRLEGAGVALAALAVAGILGNDWPWWLWPLAVVLPDLSIAGYALGPRIGAAVYNALHLYATGLIVTFAGVLFLAQMPGLVAVGLCWLAHVGIDRALGYGLKAATGFKDTHLGRIGR